MKTWGVTFEKQPNRKAGDQNVKKTVGKTAA